MLQHNFFPLSASFAEFHYIIFQEHKIMHMHVFHIVLSMANSERCFQEQCMIRDGKLVDTEL